MYCKRHRWTPSVPQRSATPYMHFGPYKHRPEHRWSQPFFRWRPTEALLMLLSGHAILVIVGVEGISRLTDQK